MTLQTQVTQPVFSYYAETGTLNMCVVCTLVLQPISIAMSAAGTSADGYSLRDLAALLRQSLCQPIVALFESLKQQHPMHFSHCWKGMSGSGKVLRQPGNKRRTG